jgi:predicted Zn finger-like uncharacterized protein
MFTICPKCALTLVVTAADLRVAQGYVRCGRCSSVFNALARLSDERQAAAPGAEPDPGAPAEPAPPHTAGPAHGASAPAAPLAASVPETDAQPTPPAEIETDSAVATETGADEPVSEDELEFDPASTDVTALFVEQPPNPEWTAATGSFKAMLAANQEEPASPSHTDTEGDLEIDAAFLAAMLQGEATGEHRAPPPAAAAPPATPPVVPQDVSPRRPPARVLTAAPPPLAAAAAAVATPPADEEEEAPPWQRYRWHLGAAAGVLFVVLQILNHYRDELAATARFHRPLTALYGALGVQLVPRWDLHAYDVRQLGAAVDAGGAGLITVRASIKNSAPQAQPLPLLRVTLQDRFGNRIAARDVAPAFYVPHAMPPSSFLSAGQRIDAEMGFVDPGANAVGFEIDACLPASGGGVACANDSGAR